MPVNRTVTKGTGDPRPTKPSPAPRMTTCTFCAWIFGEKRRISATSAVKAAAWHEPVGALALHVTDQESLPAIVLHHVPADALVVTPQSLSPETNGPRVAT
jgi:hypothetical protein